MTVRARCSKPRRRLVMAVGVAICAVACLPAAAAQGAVRFAAPGGVAAGSCPQTAPCDLEFAVETAAQPNDEVVVAPGTYALGPDTVGIGDPGLDLHGQAGQPRPLITSSAAFSAVEVPVPATVRHLRIVYTGGTYGLNLRPGTGQALAEAVVVEAGGLGACRLGNAAIRDSVCRSTAPGTDALVVVGSGSGNDAGATATNVTAIAGPTFTGSDTFGVFMDAQSGATLILQGKNVIARGVDGDIRVETSGNGSSLAAAFLIHSNFAEATGGGIGSEAVPVPGTSGNQTAAPIFEDPLAGDFHQSSGSPTINAGTGGIGLGTTDLDGEPRTQGSAPDIGADEFAEAPPPPPPAGPPAQGGSPAVHTDHTPPVLSRASLSRRRFRVATRRTRGGTTVRFSLSEPAKVTLELARRQPGRRIRRHGKTRCVKPTWKLRRKRSCTRHRRTGSLTRTSPAGRTSLAFSGRVGRRKLRPGRYRLRLFATDSAGNRSRSSDLRFTIVRSG